MKRQLPYATIMIFILVVLCINIVSAASLPGNTLCITNASGIAPGETATVGIYLNNSFNPKAGSITFAVTYDETIIQAQSVNVTDDGVVPTDLSSPIRIAIATTNGIPTGKAWLANITFRAKDGTGQVSPLGLNLETLDNLAIPPRDLIPDTLIQNGTFTTANVPAPVANFTGMPTTGTVPLTVAFTDVSTGTPTGWNWSFGDGSLVNATNQHPVHTYTNAGVYTVSLNATNAGGSDTTTRTNYITVTEPAFMSVTNATGIAPGETATVGIFLNNSFSPKVGSITFAVAYNETIIQAQSVNVTDDGVVPTDLSSPIRIALATTNGIPTGKAWLANITFRAKDGTGQVSPLGLNLETLDNLAIPPRDLIPDTLIQNGTFTTANVPAPVANFTGTPSTGTVPLTVTFTDTSTNTPTGWNWSFGDGSLVNATEQHPVHTYTSAGIYTVSLNATNAGGSDTTTRTNYITVTEPALLSVTNASGIAPGETATVGIYLNNSFNPKAGSITFAVTYDETIIQAQSVNVTADGVVPTDLSSPIRIAIATTNGIPNGKSWLANITFRAKDGTGQVSPLGLNLETLDNLAIPPLDLIPDTLIQNGTFTTAKVPALLSVTNASGIAPGETATVG
ncbi:MAG: PKD domain-containing protein, partial [Methanoregula sp.]